ncbi:TPR_21 domain-containing protein [Azospirillaceae bacterium]
MNQDEIFREVEEEIRRDRFIQLARQYGGWVVGAALLIVAATAVHVGWNNWSEAQREKETSRLVSALDVSATQDGNGRRQAEKAMASLAKELGGSRATLALLFQAGLHIRDDDAPDKPAKATATDSKLADSKAAEDKSASDPVSERAAAVAIYDQIATDPNADPVLRDLALLLSAMHRLDDADPMQLETKLAPLTLDSSPWRFSAREMTAIVAARRGDKARAHTLLQQLADDQAAPSGVRARAGELAALYGKSG